MHGSTSQRYLTLDGLRGIAAILVVGRHAGPLGYTTPESFLAVDLFFCLSGFVISRAYDTRLAQGGFVGRFVLKRLIRLYPLYLLGLVLGVCASLYAGMDASWPVVIAALFMLPINPWTAGAVGTFNAPVWTLPLELFANLVYAACFRIMTVRVLMLITLVSGTMLVISARLSGNIDIGWSIDQLPVGLSRMGFSFAVGVLIARLRPSHRAEYPLTAWMCIAVAETLLIFRPPDCVHLGYELFAILIGFPLVVLVASRSEPSRGAGRMFAAAGAVSYAVYVLHAPLARLIVYPLLASGIDWQPDRVELMLFLAAVVIVASLADKFFDRPVRRLLTFGFRQRGIMVMSQVGSPRAAPPDRSAAKSAIM